MYDIQRIGKIISDVEKYVNELESYNLSLNDLYDSKNYNASSMLIFAILNRITDLGNEVIFAENLGAPNSYQDIMLILSKANVINKSQAEKFNKLIRQRNVFAHFYEDINEKELFKIIKEINELKNFLKVIKKRVKI